MTICLTALNRGFDTNPSSNHDQAPAIAVYSSASPFVRNMDPVGVKLRICLQN